MPAFRYPPDSPEPPASSSHYHLEASSAHIYLVLVAAAVFVAIRLAATRLGSSHQAPSWTPRSQIQDVKDSLGPESRKDSAASYSQSDSAVHPPWAPGHQRVRLGFWRESPQAIWTTNLLSLGGGARQFGPTGLPRAMDEGTENAQRKDHSGSASVASRGVSTGAPSAPEPRSQQNPTPAVVRIGPSTERRRESRSPRSSPQASPSRRHSGSSDGVGEKRYKGKGPMAGHSSSVGRPRSPGWGEESVSPQFGGDSSLAGSTQDTVSFEVDYSASRIFSRPPPPPPLTPPTLSSVVFPFEDRRPSYAVSVPPELETSFIHQPNPDYMGGSTSTDILSSSPRSASATPRRRSYAKSIPIGIPIPSTTSASSSAETMTSGETFSPSSYPPTSPLLPPPPPSHDFPYEYEFVGGPGGPGIAGSHHEIDVQGEIISVIDDTGHGWKRHTRVYGGGVCLACVAAGNEPGQGGFYGDTVPLEDRR